jgi:hypothetical protein
MNDDWIDPVVDAYTAAIDPTSGQGCLKESANSVAVQPSRVGRSSPHAVLI